MVNENGVDVFVHYTNIECHDFRGLKKGQTVDYEERSSEKELFGLHVQILSEEGCVASDDEQELKFF